MTRNNKIKYYKPTKEKNNKKTKIILIIGLIAIIISTTIIITKNKNNTTKISKIGKNSTSQEIVDYILNISSYETQIDVEIKSNKNSNKYKLSQSYIKDEKSIQEVIEPQNIQGVKIIKEKNNLKIENTKLSLTKIIENYQDITQNTLDLSAFIENYKNNKNSKYTEQNKNRDNNARQKPQEGRRRAFLCARRNTHTLRRKPQTERSRAHRGDKKGQKGIKGDKPPCYSV